MSGLRTFSCVVVLCGAMANVAIAGPKIEARGEFGRLVGGSVGREFGREIGDRVEDYIRGVDREPQAPREPIRDLYDYGYSFGHAW